MSPDKKRPRQLFLLFTIAQNRLIIKEETASVRHVKLFMTSETTAGALILGPILPGLRGTGATRR
jgi:hypothetical protein